MRKSILSSGTILLMIAFFVISCRPEPPLNHQPVANAGADTTIYLPANTANLNGSTSTDPDNNITAYQWTKIDGPSSVSIVDANLVATQVTKLVEGIYQFELKVIDAEGLYAKDTVKVTVNPDISLPIEWQKAIGGTGIDLANWVAPTTDGGYIMAGSTESQDGDVTGYHVGGFGCYVGCGSTYVQICGYFPDALVVKLNNTGAIQWQKALGGTGSENLLCIQPTADGGYITCGYTFSNDGDVSGYHPGNKEADAWVVKLNSSGGIQWQKALGGSGCDYANRVLSTSDGGYIMAGHTDSNDGDVSSSREKDVWIVKLNSSGTIEWQKTLGGTHDEFDYALQSTTDGGYIIAGNTNSNDGDVRGFHGGESDAWIVKLSNSGTIEWQKTLGGSLYDCAKSVKPTADGGYIVSGETKSNDGDVNGANHGSQDAWVVKLSNNGALQWQKTYGGTGDEKGQSIQLTTDGGYFVTGYAFSNNGDVSGNHGVQDAWVFKLNTGGDLMWQKALGGSGNENAQCIQTTSDGGIIVAGQAGSNNGDISGYHGTGDAWILKLKL
ncbi:MAG TPA: PKD domain-containing protein [Chitinophagaceae bacterium]|nr:PKD domain-containing protein [Chitinophagaceae bacterium]